MPGTAAGEDRHLRLGGPVPPHGAAGDLAHQPGMDVAESGEGFFGEIGRIVENLGHDGLSDVDVVFRAGC